MPGVDVFDADSKLIAAMKLTTREEDALLAEASMLWLSHWGPERSPYFEVNALAFSPDGSLVAVGTSVGQVKLFNAHTGKLVRSLDDQKGKQADKKTAEKLQVAHPGDGKRGIVGIFARRQSAGSGRRFV